MTGPDDVTMRQLVACAVVAYAFTGRPIGPELVAEIAGDYGVNPADVAEQEAPR